PTTKRERDNRDDLGGTPTAKAELRRHHSSRPSVPYPSFILQSELMDLMMRDDTSGIRFSDYPFKPPKVKFETGCFHPNVDVFGNICLEFFQDTQPVMVANYTTSWCIPMWSLTPSKKTWPRPAHVSEIDPFVEVEHYNNNHSTPAVFYNQSLRALYVHRISVLRPVYQSYSDGHLLLSPKTSWTVKILIKSRQPLM
ncbi:hypothetical protein M8C21_011892, partial [Ambrosia artemisiifolia]